MRIGSTIYLDHQASTPVDARVLGEMTPYFSELFGNPHSADHSFGWSAAQAVEQSATRTAELIGSDPDEIIFTSGATEANNLALFGFAKRALKDKRRRILVSAIEHKCVLAVSRELQSQLGYTVECLPVDGEGRLILPALETALGDDVLMVSAMAVNNEIGTIQDLENISRLTREQGALLHCDAAQAPLAMNLSFCAEFVDFMSLSAHKMYGPKGIGALFIRRDLQRRIEPILYGGGQQRDLRSGTLPVPLCVGMGAAAALLNTEETVNERNNLRNRRDRFVQKLMALPWPIKLNGPQGKDRHPGNASVCFVGLSAHDILGTLQPHLAASTGSACTSGIPESSHVLRAINLSESDAQATIRFSLGRATTDDDVDEAVSLINDSLEMLASAN